MEQKELLTVIVADDETELREAVCSVIPWKEIGFRLVGSAGNGLDALQLVEQLQQAMKQRAAQQARQNQQNPGGGAGQPSGTTEA